MTDANKTSSPGRVETALQDPTTEDKVRFLRDPVSYPHRPESVQVEETHMSWVFLAGPRVYKLKKPVHYPFLDFSTLAARKHFVHEEVRLNRRLAAHVYLDATPLSLDASGHLSIGAAERIVDWLVTMKRLPEDRMLDRLLATGSATPEIIEQLANVLSRFFRSAPTERPSPEAYTQRYLREQAETVAVLSEPSFAFDGTRVDAAFRDFDEAFEAARPLIEERIRSGRIIEGHGDLRPEHVCMDDPIAIIDCLEFNRDLRLIDPFEELAFLGLECARLGAEWVFPALLDNCAQALDDRPPAALIRFYWIYRALLRARLSLVHLMEPNPRTPEKWRPQAWHYVELAARTDLIPSVRQTR